jgi:hypothetical protein
MGKMNGELILMSFYKLSYYKIEEIIDEDNNIWAISPNYLFHWDLETLQLKFSYSLGFTATYTYDKSFTATYTLL